MRDSDRWAQMCEERHRQLEVACGMLLRYDFPDRLADVVKAAAIHQQALERYRAALDAEGVRPTQHAQLS